MPSHLYPSNQPWVVPDSPREDDAFTLSVPIANYGDEDAGDHERILVSLAHDFANDHRHLYGTSPGLPPNGEHALEFHFPAGDLPAGQWQVSVKPEHDTGYSEHHLTFTVDEAQ